MLQIAKKYIKVLKKHLKSKKKCLFHPFDAIEFLFLFLQVEMSGEMKDDDDL